MKTKFEIIMDFAKGLIWPLYFLILLVAFYKPLYDTFQQVPNLVASSKGLSIAGIAIDVDRSLRAKTSPDVLKVISKLSPEGFEKLMAMTRGTPVFGDDDLVRYKNEWKELLDLKLVEITSWRNDKPNYKYELRVTNLGRDAHQFFFVIVGEITGKIIQKDDSILNK